MFRKVWDWIVTKIFIYCVARPYLLDCIRDDHPGIGTREAEALLRGALEYIARTTTGFGELGQWIYAVSLMTIKDVFDEDGNSTIVHDP